MNRSPAKENAAQKTKLGWAKGAAEFGEKAEKDENSMTDRGGKEKQRCHTKRVSELMVNEW